MIHFDWRKTLDLGVAAVVAQAGTHPLPPSHLRDNVGEQARDSDGIKVFSGDKKIQG